MKKVKLLILLLLTAFSLSAATNTTLPDVVYLVGTLDGTHWDASNSIPAYNTGGVYIFNNQYIDDAGDGFGYFRFIEFQTGLNDGRAWAPSIDWIDTEIDLSRNKTYNVITTNEETNATWYIPAGTYSFYLDLNNNILSFNYVLAISEKEITMERGTTHQLSVTYLNTPKTYELDANDATNFVGVYTEETLPSEDSEYGQGAHWQPLESFKIGDFLFTLNIGDGSIEPAYYYAMSTATNSQNTIRLYRGNVMTITASANSVITAISATGTKVDAERLDPCVSGLGTGTIVINNTSGETMRFNTINITTEDGDIPGYHSVINYLSNNDITWTTSNEMVATVDADGLVSAVSPGNTTITATTVNGISATCQVTVIATPIGVTLSPSTLKLEEGETFILTPIFEPEDATETAISWWSDNTLIATVNGQGLVTAVREGTATITVRTANGLSATCSVTVVPLPTQVVFPTTKTKIERGEQMQLSATVLPENAHNKSLTWASSDEAVATVDADGLVSAVALGKATITATTVNGISATCAVSVILYPTAISISEQELTLRINTSATLAATVLPDDATETDIAWRSSNEEVATVDNSGRVDAVGVGEATVSVYTANGLTASCLITVLPEWISGDPLYIAGAYDCETDNPDNIMELELKDNYYRATLVNAQSIILSTSRDAFWSHTLTVDNSDYVDQGTYSLVEGGDMMNLKWLSDWTVRVAADLSTINLTASTPEPQYPQVFIRWLRDNMKPQPEWLMDTKNGVNYSIENVVMPENEAFKLGGLSWEDLSFGLRSRGFAHLFEALQLYSDGDYTIKVDYQGADVDVVNVSFNLSTGRLLVTDPNGVGIDLVEGDTPRVSAEGGNIAVYGLEAGDIVSVYNMAGVMLRSEVAEAKTLRIAAVDGVYAVSVNRAGRMYTAKAMVR